LPKYQGIDCPVCGRAMQAEDDIVVCPVCGTPHHRHCYLQSGRCANADKHSSDFQWNAPESSPENNDFKCAVCGAENPKGSLFCNGCGHPLSQGAQGSTGNSAPHAGHTAGRRFGPFNVVEITDERINYAEELSEGVTYADAADFIGPNSASFLYKFRIMSKTGSSAVNWSAFLFSVFYCFYRKMYKLGLIIIALLAAAYLPAIYMSVRYVQELISQGVVLDLYLLPTDTRYYGMLAAAVMFFRVIFTAVSVYCGLRFNKFYMSHVIASVTAEKQSGRHPCGTSRFKDALASRGGVDKTAVLSVVAILFAVFLGLTTVVSFIIA